MRLVFTCGNARRAAPGLAPGPAARRAAPGRAGPPAGQRARPRTDRASRAPAGFSLAGNSPNRLINAIIGRPDFC
jgi:hypothetical protein